MCAIGGLRAGGCEARRSRAVLWPEYEVGGNGAPNAGGARRPSLPPPIPSRLRRVALRCPFRALRGGSLTAGSSSAGKDKSTRP